MSKGNPPLCGLILLLMAMLPIAQCGAVQLPAKPHSEEAKAAIMAPIVQLFDAMRSHNKAQILSAFSEGAMLQRVGSDQQVTDTDITAFAASVSSHASYLDEQLLSYEVHQQGPLASVWTLFVFYIDGKLSHCGANSFQLVHSAQGWKIHYLVDVAFAGDCEGFIKGFKE